MQVPVHETMATSEDGRALSPSDKRSDGESHFEDDVRCNLREWAIVFARRGSL